MNIFEILLNYLDISKFLIILTIILIISISYLLLSSDVTLMSNGLQKECKIESMTKNPNFSKKINEANIGIIQKEEEKSIEIKGYHQNEIH